MAVTTPLQHSESRRRNPFAMINRHFDERVQEIKDLRSEAANILKELSDKSSDSENDDVVE